MLHYNTSIISLRANAFYFFQNVLSSNADQDTDWIRRF
jgi:hypothetical protein